MKKFTSIIGFFVLSSSLFAQDIDVEQTFKKGEDLFNNQNYSEALPYLEEAANHNNDEAQFLLGKMYQLGLGTEIDYTKAVKNFEKALTIREKALEPEHPSTVMTYYSLGVALYKSQQYEESKHYLQKAYDIQEKVLGVDHPDTIKTKDYLDLVKKEMEQ